MTSQRKIQRHSFVVDKAIGTVLFPKLKYYCEIVEWVFPLEQFKLRSCFIFFRAHLVKHLTEARARNALESFVLYAVFTLNENSNIITWTLK